MNTNIFGTIVESVSDINLLRFMNREMIHYCFDRSSSKMQEKRRINIVTKEGILSSVGGLKLKVILVITTARNIE